MPNDISTLTFQNFAGSAKSAMTGMVVLNIGMNFLLSSSMGLLWNLINALQMIMIT